MSDTSGIGQGPVKPPETGGVEGGPSGGSIEKALHAKVRTLGQLKEILIENLGEEDGKKMYAQFVKSFSMLMLNQVQQAAKAAKQASKSMKGEG